MDGNPGGSCSSAKSKEGVRTGTLLPWHHTITLWPRTGWHHMNRPEAHCPNCKTAFKAQPEVVWVLVLLRGTLTPPRYNFCCSVPGSVSAAALDVCMEEGKVSSDPQLFEPALSTTLLTLTLLPLSGTEV